MQLQNKEVKVRYSIVFDRDELDDTIYALHTARKYLIAGTNERVTSIVATLEAFRGRDLEPTETCDA